MREHIPLLLDLKNGASTNPNELFGVDHAVSFSWYCPVSKALAATNISLETILI
jgi:organic hydroperoxide reductase OsmC/OhrA